MQSTCPINSPSQLDPNPSSPKPKHPHGNNTGLKQAYQFRDLAASQALELKDASGDELAEKLARAKALQANSVVWAEACDRIRILRGKPLPGSLRPIAKPKKPKHIPSTPSEEPSTPPS